MDYVTADIVFSQAIPDLFTPGITTSTCCAGEYESIFEQHYFGITEPSLLGTSTAVESL